VWSEAIFDSSPRIAFESAVSALAEAWSELSLLWSAVIAKPSYWRATWSTLSVFVSWFTADV